MTTQTIGQRIKLAREKTGMNQTQLAKALGITPTGVSNWEVERWKPRPEMLTKVAAALGVDRNYLETGETPQSGSVAPVPVAEKKVATVAEVLTNAKAEIAALLNLPVSAVKLDMSVTA